MSFHNQLHLLHNQQNSSPGSHKFQRAQQGHQAKYAHQDLLQTDNRKSSRNRRLSRKLNRKFQRA